MAARSKIEWTDSSWNPIRARLSSTGRRTGEGDREAVEGAKQRLGWHCTHVSEGCRNCYAETWNKRFGTGLDYKPGHERDITLFLDEKMLTQPLRWTRPRKIFVGSMTDLFADFVSDEWLDRIFAVMAIARRHTFQILTKRPERMRAYITSTELARCDGRGNAVLEFTKNKSDVYMELLGWPLPNVWLGTSCEDQATADERIPHLLAAPAALRFLSCEPLLSEIDLIEAVSEGKPTQAQIDSPRGLHYLRHGAPRIDWIICGGESGQHARPMHPDWAHSLRDQCASAGVPFFFKQWGVWRPPLPTQHYDTSGKSTPRALLIARDGTVHHFKETAGDGAAAMIRMGKSVSGRLLEHVEHNAFPAEALRAAA